MRTLRTVFIATFAVMGPAACGAAGTAPNGASKSARTSAADAKSAATGDIPDNQVFLTFHDASAGYAIQHPEGWTQQGSGRDVTFRNKANLIHVVVTRGAPPTIATVASGIVALKASDATLVAATPAVVALGRGTAIKVTFSRLAPPDPVTGKRVELIVDRYVYARAGKIAMVDLGTTKGVDNVDAYKMISRGFRWR